MRLKPGRNDLCPCGSLQKYKACCGRLRAVLPPQPPREPLPPREISRLQLEPLAALLSTGRFVELEEQARALLVTYPHAGVVWQLLGVALSKRGKDALHTWMTAAEFLPEEASVHLNLGNALGKAGRLDDAAASYGRALALQPEFAEAHNNLGEVQLDLGQLELAIASFRRAIRVKPAWADAQRNLGTAALRAGHYQDALACCQLAVQLAPDGAAEHNSLGNALCKLARLSEAIGSFRRALLLQPNFVEAQANLANALRSMGRVEEAVEGYRRAIQIQPAFVPARIELATALRVLRRTDESQAACREALRLAPDSAEPLVVLAELRADQGHFPEAEDLFRSAARIDPQSVEAWTGLARVRRLTAADDWWLKGAQTLLDGGLTPQREMTLQFAVGKYFDDLRDFSKAFLHYERANEVARRYSPRHDRHQLQRTIDLIIESHDSMWVVKERRAPSSDNQSAQPIFIVGMLRSGTTLVEQILSSHPDVAGAGELTFWSHELARLVAAATGTHPQRLRVDDSRLDAARHDYLNLLAQDSGGAAQVVDKLPTNFLSIGLIHAALPRARIISLRRNPRDTCLSIYFQHFEAANTYSHDLEDLADYFRQYQRLMNHWRSVLPVGAMLDVCYEELVAQPVEWTRMLLEFIGVPWNPLCLDFHRTARTVVTASKWQVRQPIGPSSVDRWRHYERFIGPLMSLAADNQD